MQLVTEIRLYKSRFTVCYLSEEHFLLANKDSYKCIGVKSVFKESNVGDSIDIKSDDSGDINKSNAKVLKLYTSALFLQPFVKECLNSHVYRNKVLVNLNTLGGNPENKIINLKLILKPPEKEIIDYAWNIRMLQIIWSRVEIENAFSWLSTLGGAYSALGDYFDYCAEEAGRISVRQYKLSKMLGDDGLAERSKLYSALAYAQKGRLKLARHIVRNVAAFAQTAKDKRLNRMCQGVWVKLKYLKLTQSVPKGIILDTSNLNMNST